MLFAVKSAPLVAVFALILSIASAQIGAPPPKNIVDFTNKQMKDYFTDCQAFAESFSEDFRYCDAVPCMGTRGELLELCGKTLGTQNKHHVDLVLKPSSFPQPGNWKNFSMEGKQSVCLAFDETGPRPFCFSFTIVEHVEDDATALFGIKSTGWSGFYTLDFDTCAGFEPVNCRLSASS